MITGCQENYAAEIFSETKDGRKLPLSMQSCLNYPAFNG